MLNNYFPVAKKHHNSVFARYDVWLGRSWGEKHVTIVLKPSNVAIQGQPNPPTENKQTSRIEMLFPGTTQPMKIQQPIRLQTCFPKFFY